MSSRFAHVFTVRDILAVVERIRAVSGDDEHAHGLEDDLHQRVLELVAQGKAGPDEASAALQTKSIEFSRWAA